MITDEQVAEWRRLEKCATTGPWINTGGRFPKVNGGPVGDLKVASLLFADDDDAAFIAASRYAVPALLAERDELRAEIEQLRSAMPV